MLNKKVIRMANLCMIGGLLFNPVFAEQDSEGMSRLEQGKAIAFARFPGPCQA